ncbi:MAG: GIY-YIG nuclease family protein [Bacteroidales bacterium]|nr:GIY-YIG nuclease family protein [Bacteroidales bacterium]
MERGGYTYLMTNKNNTVIYTGVTSNLRNRVYEHKEKIYSSSFTKRYNISKLVYFETFVTIEEAITREKQIKGGSRQKKIDLINGKNPKWKDLCDDIKDFD